MASKRMGPPANLDHRQNPILAEKTVPVDLAEALEWLREHGYRIVR